MKKILFIILPIDSATGICTKNVGKELKNRGYNVDFVTFKISKEIKEDGFGYFEINYPFFLKMSNNVKNEKIKSFFYNMYRIKNQLFTFVWPLNSFLYVMKLYFYVLKLVKENDYDCIIPVYAQIESSCVGYLLKKKFPNKFVVFYFLDSLSSGATPLLLSESKKIKYGLWWEKKLLHSADGIVFMESSRLHHEKYNINQSFWKNTVFMDIPSFCSSEQYIYKGKIHEKDTINMVYVGTLPLKVRDPRIGLRLLKDSLPHDIKFNIYFVGPKPNSKGFIEECSEILPINWIGKLPHEQAVEYIRNADVVLNFGNRMSGMVPSKIFEYFSYFKPLISFSPNKNDPSIPYVERYDLGCSVIETIPEKYNIEKIKKFLLSLDSKIINKSKIETEFYKNSPKCFCDYIDNFFINDNLPKGENQL